MNCTSINQIVKQQLGLELAKFEIWKSYRKKHLVPSIKKLQEKRGDVCTHWFKQTWDISSAHNCNLWPYLDPDSNKLGDKLRQSRKLDTDDIRKLLLKFLDLMMMLQSYFVRNLYLLDIILQYLWKDMIYEICFKIIGSVDQRIGYKWNKISCELLIFEPG